MRKSILAPIAIVICLAAQAQDYKADVKKQFQEYMNLNFDQNFTKAMDYINPALFKIISKEQMIKVFEAAMNDPQVEVAMEKENSKILSVGDKQTISGMNYVKLQYFNSMKMRFKAPGSESMDTTVIKQLLEKQFGNGNVSYNAETKSYRIVKYENVVANSADNKKWTFITVESKQKAMLEKILPKELL